MTYKEALETLNGKQRRKLRGHTYLEIIDNFTIGIKYYNTYIIKFFKDGSIQLHTDGYRTTTTRQRINKYTNAGLYQKNRVWYFSDGREFEDGVIL